ncbi:uncharacterized protein LOC114541658 [Dendronephthya gigantea]|uniref:uncharacterized protein LOC114541658 n=1 Tax=Dendronephthya gigantea TaxID=151771 RepID=UPI00106D62B6|nr:uncharacterized protein LOC114541658 [Dendronephthya gigantea]
MAAKTAPEIIPFLDIRVLDSVRKSSFRVRQLTQFPVVKTIGQMRKELIERLPDVKNVETCQLGYVLERNKKYSIGSDDELQKAFGHFRAGYQMWLDPASLTQNLIPAKTSTGKSAQSEKPTSSKESIIQSEIEQLQKMHGDSHPAYKYRLWAEMIIVGTANRQYVPDVPMFHATPAKRPRRETWSNKLGSASETIARAITAGQNAAKQNDEHVNQPGQSTASGSTDASKAIIRTQILKQIKELYELKTIGAITDDEYNSKKYILLKDLN